MSVEHVRGLVAGQLGVQGRLLLGLQHLAAGSMIIFIIQIEQFCYPQYILDDNKVNLFFRSSFLSMF